jgi:hypothetical protein
LAKPLTSATGEVIEIPARPQWQHLLCKHSQFVEVAPPIGARRLGCASTISVEWQARQMVVDASAFSPTDREIPN